MLLAYNTLRTFSLHFHIPVKRRGRTTLEGGDKPAAFFAKMVAVTLLSLLKVATCVKLIGTANVSAETSSVCCRFSSEFQRVTSKPVI